MRHRNEPNRSVVPDSLLFHFSILSKILTVSESTLIYRKRLRSIYRDYQNEQRTVKHIQCGRLKFVEEKKCWWWKISHLVFSSYSSLDKPVIQYNNGDPLKYHLPYQQQFYSTQNGFHRSQSERTNREKYEVFFISESFVNCLSNRTVLDDEHGNAQE